jgi:hypothetical protein
LSFRFAGCGYEIHGQPSRFVWVQLDERWQLLGVAYDRYSNGAFRAFD